MKKLLALCLMAGIAAAQAPASGKKATFEVASVKANTSGQNFVQIGGMGGGRGGRFTVTNMPLQQLIVLAYAPRTAGPMMIGPNAFPVTGAPGWISSERFDIDARAEAGFTPTQEQSQEMLQSLLEERFGLKVRKETKDGPIYALVVDKGGPKLKLSADQTPVNFNAPPPGAGPGGPGGPTPTPGVRTGGGPPPPPPPPGGGPGGAPFGGGPAPRGGIFMGLGQFKAGAAQVSALAGPLSSQLGRKVVDRTNLTGLYDIDLKWTPDALPNGAALPPGVQLPQVDPNGPSIFTAVQEQLGLKLESSTGPIDSLVVEKVEKLIEN